LFDGHIQFVAIAAVSALFAFDAGRLAAAGLLGRSRTSRRAGRRWAPDRP
jgi:hypothetical protein